MPHRRDAFLPLLVILGSCAEPPAPRTPAPTEHRLDEDAEERNRHARKEWIQQMHRAPAGVDTKDVERENGLRQLRRRAVLRRAPPSDPVARWVERGSINQAGRMHAAAFNADKDTLYAGSSLGGVWVSDPDGATWAPIGDNLYGGAHWLEVLSPGDVVVAATDGGLVHRSEDGGQSWEAPTGLPALTSVRRLLKLEDGSEAVFLVGCANRSCGVYRSEDLGRSFQEVADLGDFSGDLWAPRDGGSALYLAGPGGRLQRSEDGGEAWTTLGTFNSQASRAELTGSEAGGPWLYVISGGQWLARSDDGGQSWTSLGSVSDYWGELVASIQDPGLFAYGGMELHVSTDAGATFAIQNAWGDYYGDPANLLHADMMGLRVTLDAAGDEVWFIGTDGGLYRSRDQLLTVENLSLHGLRVSQYYSTLTSSSDPTHVAAGAQDQGYQLTTGQTQTGEILAFDQTLSGDYGHLTSADGSHAYVFSVYPGFILVQTGEDRPRLAYGDFPSGERYVPWLPPIVADPDDRRAFFFPATRLYRYTVSGQNVRPALYSDQDFSTRNDEYISSIEFSPLDSQLAFAGTSEGRFYTSTDHGVTWTLSDDLVPDDNWYYGQSILPSRVDPQLLYVGGSGYGVPAVYRSRDGGADFEPWGEGLPDTLVYCLCEAPDGSGRVLAGTETSVYLRGADDPAWVDITDATAPITIYWSCESLTAENTVRFATYGRGIWDYQLDPDHEGCFPVQDFDGDGVACDVDCDDHDVDVYPGAVDACDGRDINCDGAPEDDADGDGARACDDCDDADPTRSPLIDDICGDGVDQNCSGADLPCAVEPRCSCAAGPEGGGLWGLLLLPLLVRRRRR